MPLLTIFLLLASCLPIAWPESPLGLDRRESVLATVAMVFVCLTIAMAVRTWVVLSLRRDPARRSVVGRGYLRLRFLLHFFNLTCVLVAVLGLGWGEAVQGDLLVEHNGVWRLPPFAELAVPLPYFVILFGIWAIYFDAERALHLASWNASQPFWSRGGYVLHQTRQVMLFLFLPLGLFVTNQSLLRWEPDTAQSGWFRLASTVGILGLIVLMPAIIRPLLGLKPMPPGPTRDRLLGLARRLDFRFRELLVWPTRGGMVNAMILGLVPRLRYVIFTDRILDEMPPDQLDAVFGHEAGHAKHGHIHYYLAFLILSMGALAALGLAAAEWLEPRLTLPQEYDRWLLLPPLFTVAAYLFLVFGFLSRRCERQADVYGAWAVSCGNPRCTGHDEATIFPQGRWSLCPTGLRSLAEALERVQLLNGHGHDEPRGWVRRLWAGMRAWMHGPIPRRTAYLLSLIDHPARERRMQRRVTALRWGLLVALGAILVIFGERVGWENLIQAM